MLRREAILYVVVLTACFLVSVTASFIQFDAPHYTAFLNSRTSSFYEEQGWTLDQWLDRGIEVDSAAMQKFPEVTFGFHLCRGNQGSRWLVEGGYDRIARPIFRKIAAPGRTVGSCSLFNNRGNAARAPIV